MPPPPPTPSSICSIPTQRRSAQETAQSLQTLGTVNEITTCRLNYNQPLKLLQTYQTSTSQSKYKTHENTTSKLKYNHYTQTKTIRKTTTSLSNYYYYQPLTVYYSQLQTLLGCEFNVLKKCNR